MKARLVCLSMLLACHHAPAAFGRVLERGGEVDVEDTKLRVDDSTVVAWGVLEVPDGSRMSAAYAGADAIARAELLKFVRVRIEGEVVSVDSTDPARRTAYERTLETVDGRLRHAGRTQHAWERVQHEDRVLLRVWSRLTVARADVEAALRAASLDRADGTSAPPAR